MTPSPEPSFSAPDPKTQLPIWQLPLAVSNSGTHESKHMMCLPQVYHCSFAQTVVLLAMGQELLPPASVRSWATWSDPPRFQLHLTYVLLTPGSAALVSDSPFHRPSSFPCSPRWCLLSFRYQHKYCISDILTKSPSFLVGYIGSNISLQSINHTSASFLFVHIWLMSEFLISDG